MKRLLPACLLLGLVGCTRDWPVPLRGYVSGEVPVPGDKGDACKLSVDVLDSREALRRALGPGFADRAAALGHATDQRPDASEVEEALRLVAWGKEYAVLVLSGTCDAGARLERVVQPGSGSWRWEARLTADMQPSPKPTLKWQLAAALRGDAPPLEVVDAPAHLTPGPEKLRFTAVPRRP